MAVVDPLYQQHYRTWIGFTRLIKFGLLAMVILLVGMAIFLL
jgi:hypothetical protein